MRDAFKPFLQRWLINTVAVLVAAHVVRGIHYDSVAGLLVATLVLGLLNAFLRPLLLLLSLPLLLFTFGLFILIINAALLGLVGFLVESFHVEGFWSAFFGALVISIITVVLNSFTRTGDAQVRVHRSKPRPRPPDSDGGGPVIDV